MKSLWLILFSTTVAFGQGTILWNESVNGALSQSSSNPTALPPLQLGTNTIFAKVEIAPVGNNWVSYDDFFSLAIPANSLVTSIYLQTDKPNVWHWIGDASFTSQLAFVGNPSNGDLLPQWGLSSLLAGNYGMYVANTDTQPVLSIASYRLDFFVQPVPEPSAFSLLLLGAGFVGLRCWRTAWWRTK